MPEARLERTRVGVAAVPPCVRLGHFSYVEGHTGDAICRRCGLRLMSLDRHRWEVVARIDEMQDR